MNCIGGKGWGLSEEQGGKHKKLQLTSHEASKLSINFVIGKMPASIQQDDQSSSLPANFPGKLTPDSPSIQLCEVTVIELVAWLRPSKYVQD